MVASSWVLEKRIDFHALLCNSFAVWIWRISSARGIKTRVKAWAFLVTGDTLDVSVGDFDSELRILNVQPCTVAIGISVIKFLVSLFSFIFFYSYIFSVKKKKLFLSFIHIFVINLPLMLKFHRLKTSKNCVQLSYWVNDESAYFSLARFPLFSFQFSFYFPRSCRMWSQTQLW